MAIVNSQIPNPNSQTTTTTKKIEGHEEVARQAAKVAKGAKIAKKSLQSMARSVELVPRTSDEVRAMIGAMAPDARAQLSAEWLALFEASTATDPWVHGFVARDRATGTVVGQGGFKGPPGGGVVEIAYGTEAEHRGKGYATETANALVDYAFGSPEVTLVIAHTLPDSKASQRVLAKCGFQRAGEVVDSEDGLVWRFEKRR